MPALPILKSSTVDGVTYSQYTIDTSDNKNQSAPAIAAAKTGALTTRTSVSVGTLTMSAGHGFITADLIDLYWSGGKRVGVIVGTVATNSVPITGGSGDDLPAAATAITAMTRHSESFTVAGDDIVGILISSPVPGYVTLTAADGTTVHLVVPLTADDATRPSYTYMWSASDGSTNPVAGDSIGKILSSHGDASAVQTITTYIFSN